MGRGSPGTSWAKVRTDRLFRHDRLILSNVVRATFAAWHDRAIAASMSLAALAAVHATFVDCPWRIAAWLAVAVGTMIGIWAERLVRARLTFHAFDGLLAADALHPQTRRRYMAAWYGIGLVLLLLLSLIARPSLMFISLPAYLAGVLVTGLVSDLKIPKRIAGTARPGWTLRAWSHRPIAGMSAAIVLLILLLPARLLDIHAVLIVVGVVTLLLALLLTSVDDAIVRFMTLAGHGSRHILVHHAKGMILFLGIAIPGCWACFGPVAGGVVFVTGAVAVLLMTLRILVYIMHAKRLADFLVSVLAGLLLLTAYSTPVVFPIIALTILLQLHRRGRGKTWLMA